MPSLRTIPFGSVLLVIGLAILLVGAKMLEYGAVGLAEELGVSEVVIGVTIVPDSRKQLDVCVQGSCSRCSYCWQ